MPASKTIGVIGLGSIGMRHAKNLLAMGHTVYGYDPDEAKVTALKQLGADGRSKSLRPKVDKLDGIIIASPTKQHRMYLVDAGDGKIPCFVEKPISDELCYSVIARISQLMVGNNLRFHSCVKKAKEWLAEGLIGKPLWASFCVAQHNTKYTDPVVLNWGAHEFDLALYLLGPATVTAAAGNDKIFDTCLLHEYGVPSTIHCDYVTRPWGVRWFFIGGSEGTIQVMLEQRTMLIHGKKDEHFIDENGSFDQDYKDEMQEFIDRIDGKTEGLVGASGQDGLAALELILEAQRLASK